MQAAAIFILILCYGGAGYLTWQQRTPIYLFALLAGHLSALAAPLWALLYSTHYGLSLSIIQAVLAQPVPATLWLAAGWQYPLPALLVLFLYLTRWWFPGEISGLLTYLIFLLYHLLIELVGLRATLWDYRSLALPLGLPGQLLAAIIAALISYAFLYLLLATYRYAWQSMALAVVPAVLLISLLIQGLLSAPLWIALVLNGASWAIGLGALSALALLLWAVQIVTGGIRRVE